ncbi:MAG: preprotein translocase subunit YajC [Paracoccaceae bacterium]
MFITPAYAQAAGQAPAGSAFLQLVPLILIFAIMYFLLIRPQQRKYKEHQKMVEALRRGDQVVTSGGIIGKVSKVHENGEIDVEIASGVTVRVVRSTIATVRTKSEPAAG